MFIFIIIMLYSNWSGISSYHSALSGKDIVDFIILNKEYFFPARQYLGTFTDPFMSR